MSEHRRRDDRGVLCTIALRASQFFDWVDRRQIDAYAVSFIILWGTIRITEWAMGYANAHPEKSGVETGAIIASIMVPWSGLQGAAIKFLFDVRQQTFESRQKPTVGMQEAK